MYLILKILCVLWAYFEKKIGLLCNILKRKDNSLESKYESLDYFMGILGMGLKVKKPADFSSDGLMWWMYLQIQLWQ